MLGDVTGNVLGGDVGSDVVEGGVDVTGGDVGGGSVVGGTIASGAQGKELLENVTSARNTHAE